MLPVQILLSTQSSLLTQPYKKAPNKPQVKYGKKRSD